MPAFPDVSKIRYDGPDSQDPLAYRHYDPDEKVEGKSMRDHLRFAVCYWHTFRGMGGDPFGPGCAVRPWEDGTDSLDMALKRRCPQAGLLHHSDQGCTYASEDYRTRLARHGIACSMSRRGNCYDNAVMESWFSTVKSEAGARFESYAHAKEILFDYIEVFYNQRRRHSTLGQLSPAEFERRSSDAA